MGKQMEGDNTERRKRAAAARDAGRTPSEEGVTEGASKQRQHLGRSEDAHAERLEARGRGKADPEHRQPHPRPGG